MRVKMRMALDTTKPINLRRLSPAMKVYAGVVSKWQSTKFHQRKVKAAAEEEALRQMRQDESLKEVLLAQLLNEMEANSTLKAHGKVCKSAIVSVAANQKDSLDRIIKHRDFLSYEFELVKENQDIRTAFPDMPYLVRVKKKIV